MASLWPKVRMSRLEHNARRHEKRFEFDEAAHLYFRSAMLQQSGAHRFANLMRAASCKERSQNWRQQSGLWERLAYELAKSTGWKFPERMESFRARHLEPGQLGIFHIISYDEWMRPASALVQLTKGQEEIGLRRLQRAWAYQWGAEEAEASGRLTHAARLWRLAGLSFADEHCPLQDRFREAARAFLHGATSTLRAGEWVPMMFVATVPWDSTSIEWGDPKTEAVTESYKLDSNDPHSECRTDLEWHQYAWTNYLQGIRDRAAQADALDEWARELNQLQQLIIATGDRRHGAQLYQERMLVEHKILRTRRRWIPLLYRELYHWTSLSGSSVRRALLTAFIANVVIIPLLYWSTGAAQAGISGQDRASVPDTLILSLANVVSLSTSSAHLVTEWATALQALQAVGGYFILAFIVWVAQRFH